MKKLLARIKQWNKENAGLTLVEIIVTMLILVIIALPILGGFIVSARANAMAKDLAYARDAAENVVEVANSAGVSAEIFNAVGWGCTPTPTPSITLAPGVTVTPVPVEEYVVTGIRSGTGTYTAKVICNRTTYQDANTYDLPDMTTLDAAETVVVFPESNFYKFKYDETLGEEVLDEGTDLHQFDTTAINDFYLDYYDSIVEIYNNVIFANYYNQVTLIETENQKRMAQPTPVPTMALPEQPDYLDSGAIRKKEELNGSLQPIKTYMHRTMNVKVTYAKAEEADEDGVQATVSTEYEYVMKDKDATETLLFMINASFDKYLTAPDKETKYSFIYNPFVIEESVDWEVSFSAAEIEAAKQAATASVLDELENAKLALKEKLSTPKTYKVAADTTVDTLENIYLIVSPFNSAPKTAVTPAPSIDISSCNTLWLDVELKNEVGILDEMYLRNKEVTVFVVLQEDKTPYTMTGLSVGGANSYAQSLFKPYSQTKLVSDFSISAYYFDVTEEKNKKLYKDRKDASGNELLEVTVKIYDPDNVGPGKELTEVKTTISSKK